MEKKRLKEINRAFETMLKYIKAKKFKLTRKEQEDMLKITYGLAHEKDILH